MSRLIGFIVTMISLVWGFRTLLMVHAPVVFTSPSEDLSHGWFIPLFSLYVVWTEWPRIRKSAAAPSWGGVLAMLPFLLLGLMGVRGVQIRFEILAFAGLLVTIPWAFYGRRMARSLLFPAAFLLFCLPLAAFLDVVTVPLRLFTTALAHGILSSFGIAVSREGTVITSLAGNFSIDVATPCSGIRSIFALMALAAGFAYFNFRSPWRRAAVFALSIPLAIIANLMRIVTICIVAHVGSANFAIGFYHDYSGYLVFAVALLLLVALGGILRERDDNEEDARPSVAAPAAPAPSLAPMRRFFAIPAVAAVLVIGTMVMLAVTPEPTLCEDPGLHLSELAGYRSQERAPTEAELTTLPDDTRIEHRHYFRGDGIGGYDVSLIVGGRSKSSIHRPELCLPSQGYQLGESRTIRRGGREWHLVSVLTPDRHRAALAYTFFNQSGFATGSHSARIFRDVCDRTFYNRIDRWAMLSVYAVGHDVGRIGSMLDSLEVLR